MEEWLGDLDEVDKKAALEQQEFEELQQAKKQETENLKKNYKVKEIFVFTWAHWVKIRSVDFEHLLQKATLLQGWPFFYSKNPGGILIWVEFLKHGTIPRTAAKK